jgi:MFS family permease
MSTAKSTSASIVTTLIPARLERLPWGRFHVLVIAALGVTWILDGLEVTLAGSVAAALKESPALRFSDSEVGFAGSAYLLGAVAGALFFGWLTDRLGRKKLFFTTIVVYLTATALTGLAWNGFSFFLFRFFTGCGVGGEYSAINSTIQELVPARYRGQLDLTINGSFWVGAALGALVAVALLNPALIPSEFGWRLAFLTGAALGVVVFFMRMWIPESPRWLVIHGREKEGEVVVEALLATKLTTATRSRTPEITSNTAQLMSWDLGAISSCGRGSAAEQRPKALDHSKRMVATLA